MKIIKKAYWAVNKSKTDSSETIALLVRVKIFIN
jgi:hypothetical protein